MATLVVNLSGGNLHLDTLELVLPPGGRHEFQCSEDELLSMCPEMISFKLRGRVRISEDAELVEPAPASEVEDPTPATEAPVEDLKTTGTEQ